MTTVRFYGGTTAAVRLWFAVKGPMVVKQRVATVVVKCLGVPRHRPRILQRNRTDDAHGLRPGLAPDTRAGGEPHLVVEYYIPNYEELI